ncbi:MAG: DMT family transporter [Phototrophicaceae bacterium]
MTKETRNGLLFMIFSVLGYATLPIVGRAIYLGENPPHPYTIVGWRFLIAIPLMWLLVMVWHHLGLARLVNREIPNRALLMFCGALNGAGILLGWTGLSYLTASQFTIASYTYPAFVFLLNSLLGNRVSGRGWVAFAMTALGLTLFALNGDSSHSVALNFPLGMSLTIAGAILFAVHVIVTHRVLDGYPTTARVTAWIITGYSVILIPLTLMGKMVLPSDWKTFFLLAELASLHTVLPTFAFMMGMMRLGTARASIISTLEPVIALVLAMLILSEQLVVWQQMGATLIFLSVVVQEFPLQWLRRRIQTPASSTT